MTAPWKLAKDSQRAEVLDHALFALAEALRVIAIVISPVLPNAAREILYQLNCADEFKFENTNWGGLPAKHQLGKPVPLFPRIETD
jgi:methionyl-tRNA synthetase